MNKDSYRLYKRTWVFKSDPHKECRLGLKDVSGLFSRGGNNKKCL